MGVPRQLYEWLHIIGASLSEPLLDELAGAMFWYIYIYTVYDRIHARACISLSLLFGPASIRARRLYEPRRLLDENADARVTKF